MNERTSMLKTQSQAIPYHGWLIEVVPQGGEFVFQCYPPQLTEFCNDATAYASSKAALVAGCHFIDREIAVLTLIEQVAEWLESGQISEEEYWNLTSFD
jgi:hypothetical protein